MRCRDESWALNAEREEKDTRSLAVVGLLVGGVQTTFRAARRLWYLQ